MHALLGRLHARSRMTGHRDGTVYGSSRSATRSFYTHHVRMLSQAIAISVGESIANYSCAAKSRLACDAPRGEGEGRGAGLLPRGG